jgi:hypothetical protein
MGRARIDETIGREAVRAVLASTDASDVTSPATTLDATPSRDQLATAVRYLLQCLSDSSPGRSVEVRVPPFGAAQIVEGPRHSRGTPANVVELDARTFIALAATGADWSAAAAAGSIHASGSRSDLSHLMPVQW